VEAVLREHSEVSEAVVIMSAGVGGVGQRLVGYVVAAGEAELGVAELRAHLQERLPEYMVPSALVLLPQLPLTANGKVDRRALSDFEPDRPRVETVWVAPETKV